MQVFGRLQLGIDTVAEDFDVTARFVNQRTDNANRGRLASTIRTK